MADDTSDQGAGYTKVTEPGMIVICEAFANADGSGGRLELPRVGDCNWVERTALCLRWESGQPNQVVVLTDEGHQFSVTTHDTSFWPATAQLTRHRLFYIAHEGGLYVVEHRRP